MSDGEGTAAPKRTTEDEIKTSRVTFVSKADEEAPLLAGGEEEVRHRSASEASVEGQMHGEHVVTRKRSRTHVAEQRDLEMQRREAERTFFQRYSKALVLIPYVVLQGASGVIFQPMIPEIMSDYFGGEKKAAAMTSYVATVAAMVGMVTAAPYGRLLDTVGRKWFFPLATLCQLALPQLLLILFRHQAIFYLIATSTGSLIQQSFQASYIADNFSSKSRVKVFAAMLAVGNLTAFCALISSSLEERLAMIIGCCLSFAAVLYSAIFIKESIPDDVRTKLTADACLHNPFSTMTFLLKSKVCRVVIAMTACFLFAQVGVGDIYMYYLAERVGFTKTDNAYLFVEAGVMTPLVMLLLLPFLSRRLSPTMIIFISLVALFVELIVIATIWAKWPVFAIVIPLVSLTMMMMPLLQTVLANAGNPADQGRRLTGFVAVADLCNALGPLVFGSIYGNVTGTLVVLPFVIAAFLCIPNGVLAFWLPRFMDEEREAKEAAALYRAACDSREESNSKSSLTINSAPDS